MQRSHYGIRLLLDLIKNNQRCVSFGCHLLFFCVVIPPPPPRYCLRFGPGTIVLPIQKRVLIATTTPLVIILPVLLNRFSAIKEASSRLWRYIVAGNFDHNPYLPLSFPVHSNFTILRRFLRRRIHPLNSKPVLITGVEQVSVDEYFYYCDSNTYEFFRFYSILLDLGVRFHQINNANRGFALMKDSNLRTTLNMLWAVLEITRKFSNKGRRMGRKVALVRVIKSLWQKVNQENISMRQILQAYGKEEGGD